MIGMLFHHFSTRDCDGVEEDTQDHQCRATILRLRMEGRQPHHQILDADCLLCHHFVLHSASLQELRNHAEFVSWIGRPSPVALPLAPLLWASSYSLTNGESSSCRRPSCRHLLLFCLQWSTCLKDNGVIINGSNDNRIE